jgi:putative selenate reductase
MRVQPFGVLLARMTGELEQRGSLFGIPRSLFFLPQAGSPFAGSLFGHPLATPIGPAAGPHTQLAQNILSAWLSGGRFIELKTVQAMDALEIPRPCIDMEDEGYNVEWSQELRLDESAQEYVNAWVLVHLLHRLLGFEGPVGTVFNMSVGYDMAGILTPPMQRFMDRMADASAEIAPLVEAAARAGLPAFETPPPRICDSVTLSTMHGCPPGEIEQIARYLIEERGLHTIVKLNPTLLGRDAVLGILHDDLGFREMEIPDAVFEHDLQYDRAVSMIRALKQVAAGRGVTFGVKLSNTLGMRNHKGTLPGEEMYMSGRALYPITVTLFQKLVREFDGDLYVSYAGGADEQNLAGLLACGALPVTAASDLLKPGGYSRTVGWLEELGRQMEASGTRSLGDLARDRLGSLETAAARARTDPRYKKIFFRFGLPKVQSALDAFDCIAAPCVEQCAVCQDVPEYAWCIARGEGDRALEIILARNPLPGITGYVCTHLCEARCTRNNYDEPVAIRDLKRFAQESAGRPVGTSRHRQAGPAAKRVAIIGGGPSGLAAAYFLAQSGLHATIFEERAAPGGMPYLAPRFRLPMEVVRADVDRILAMGVELRLGQRVEGAPEALLGHGFDAVYIACGLQEDARLEIEGMEGADVFPALDLLESVARGAPPVLGRRVLVIGGGNTAMDAARTARRLTGHPVTIVYRRTRAEMPAEAEELRDLFDEGNLLVERAMPHRVIREDGRIVALECLRTELGEPEADGRRRAVPVAGSAFRIEADAVVLAIGQQPALDLPAGGATRRRDGTIVTEDGGLVVPGDLPIFAGGDVTRGPETIIAACADGRRAAEAICRRLGVDFLPPPLRPMPLTDQDVLQLKGVRARRAARHRAAALPAEDRAGFRLVEGTLSSEDARAEAERCLQCSTFCDKCVEVCPNRANYSFPVETVEWRFPVLGYSGGQAGVVGHEVFALAQARQILHVADFCNACGNCATFCVHNGRPYADKPRLFLRRADFEAEADNAFVFDGVSIWSRQGGQEARLTPCSGGIELDLAQARVTMSQGAPGGAWHVEAVELKRPFEGTLALTQAGPMLVLLTALNGPLAFLSTED